MRSTLFSRVVYSILVFMTALYKHLNLGIYGVQKMFISQVVLVFIKINKTLE